MKPIMTPKTRRSGRAALAAGRIRRVRLSLIGIHGGGIVVILGDQTAKPTATTVSSNKIFTMTKDAGKDNKTTHHGTDATDTCKPLTGRVRLLQGGGSFICTV